MNTKPRRTFLKQITLAFGVSALFPSNIFAFYTIDKEREEAQTKASLKKEAKNLFYAKMYAAAEESYNNLVNKYYDDISVYDGLAKVYLAQFKILEVISLFRSGLNKNANNPLFYDRYAKALMIMSAGYPNKEIEYTEKHTGIKPIQQAILVLIEAIELYPDKKYLREHLLRAEKSLEKKKLRCNEGDDLLNIDFSERITLLTNDLSTDKRLTKELVQSTPELKTKDEIEVLINKIHNKPRRVLLSANDKILREKSIAKEKKRLFFSLFNELHLQRDVEKTKKLYECIDSIDNCDVYYRDKMIQLFRKNRLFDDLIYLYESKKDTFIPVWWVIGLGNAYISKADYSGQSSYYDKALNLYNEYIGANKLYSASAKQLISYGKSKVYLRLNQADECRNEIISALSEVRQNSEISLLLVLYAESYSKDDITKKEKILLSSIGLSSFEEDFKDPVKDFVENYVRNIYFQNKIKKSKKSDLVNVNENSDMYISKTSLPLLYSLARHCKSQANTELYNTTLVKIEKIEKPGTKIFAKRNML